MQTLHYDDVIKTIELKHGITVRDYIKSNYLEQNIKDEDYIPHLDFWSWLFEGAGFLDNEDFGQDECHMHSFPINLDNLLKNSQKKYQKVKSFYDASQGRFSIALYSAFQAKKTNTIPHQDEFLQGYIDDFKKRNLRDIKQDLAEFNPNWLSEIIELINTDYGDYRDANGDYHFTFEYH